MRSRLVATCCLVASLLAACSSSTSNPQLTVTPSGAVTTTGPTIFTSPATGQTVTWALSGPGSLSATTGNSVVYTPPAAPGLGKTATLTASAGGATATVQLTIGLPALTQAAIPGLTAPVTVLYDAWNIPHVTCAQATDCYAVQGYLHARDRLFQMDFLRRLAVGRLAELIGPQGLSEDVQFRTLFTTRAGERLGEALARNQDAAMTAVLTRYVAGVNAYLAQLRTQPASALPGEYAQLPYAVTAADIPDWTPADVLAFARLQQFDLSQTLSSETSYGKFAAVYGPGAPLEDLGKLTAWVRAAQPASERTHTLTSAQPTPTALALLQPAPAALRPWAPGLAAFGAAFAQASQALRPLHEAVGSNNWVIAAAHSATGATMVANDPHLSLQYPPNFYLASLTSTNAADHLDLTGGAFPGIPGAQVGRGQHVGWGVTVTGYDVTDLYLEQAGPCPSGVPAAVPFCVLYKGAFVPVLPVPQTFKVRVGPGAAGLVDAATLPATASLVPPAVVIVPQHGPIVQAPDGSGRAVSVRWTGHEDWTHDLNAFLGLGTAADVDAAMAALDDYATGAQNFVLADDSGHIAYYPHALVPVRNFADARVTAPAALIPPWFPVPGDGSAEWGTGVAGDQCAAAGAGRPADACWIAKAALPQGKDPATGFYATANADPIGVSDDDNPLAHPPYLSFEWDDSTAFRHARITERLTALTTAGTGLVTEADMEALQADHVSRLGAAYTRYLVQPAFDATAAAVPEFGAARALLSQWGADGYDCPTGLTGTDPLLSPVDPDPVRSRDSSACFLFHFFERNLLQRVFADDLAVAGLGVGSVMDVKSMLYMLEPTTPAANQTFCVDVDAEGRRVATHTCSEQVVTALATAYDLLLAQLGPESAWRWGRVHTMRPNSQDPLVGTGYLPGPYARPGGAFTVDVGNPSATETGTGFSFRSSANVRHVSVMDPARPMVRMQLPGPERSVPTGAAVGGPDLLGDWARNAYFDYAHGTKVEGSAAATQTFVP